MLRSGLGSALVALSTGVAGAVPIERAEAGFACMAGLAPPDAHTVCGAAPGARPALHEAGWNLEPSARNGSTGPSAALLDALAGGPRRGVGLVFARGLRHRVIVIRTGDSAPHRPRVVAAMLPEQLSAALQAAINPIPLLPGPATDD